MKHLFVLIFLTLFAYGGYSQNSYYQTAYNTIYTDSVLTSSSADTVSNITAQLTAATEVEYEVNVNWTKNTGTDTATFYVQIAPGTTTAWRTVHSQVMGGTATTARFQGYFIGNHRLRFYTLAPSSTQRVEQVVYYSRKYVRD